MGDHWVKVAIIQGNIKISNQYEFVQNSASLTDGFTAQFRLIIQCKSIILENNKQELFMKLFNAYAVHHYAAYGLYFVHMQESMPKK